MKLTFIFVGKTKNSWIIEGENEFLKRLKKFAQVEVKIVKEIGKGDAGKIIKEESEQILRFAQNDTGLVCLLSAQGKQLSSREFAQKIQNWEVSHGGKITFIVGGSYGVSQEVEDRADYTLSFSKMTFLHEMIRVFLFEQVYRAFTILHGSEYHKGK